MKLVAVTDRTIAEQYYLRRFREVASSGIDALILREKDMDHDDYSSLAHYMYDYCNEHGVMLIVNSDLIVAKDLGSPVQIPFSMISEVSYDLSGMRFGVSVHSVEEAVYAQKAGAEWVVFGNVFETTCKPGKQGTGIDYLARVCKSVSIPVLAIGGIAPANARLCIDAGVCGVCARSPFMTCRNPKDLVREFREAVSPCQDNRRMRHRKAGDGEWNLRRFRYHHC